jgi:hypothetical protein
MAGSGTSRPRSHNVRIDAGPFEGVRVAEPPASRRRMCAAVAVPGRVRQSYVARPCIVPMAVRVDLVVLARQRYRLSENLSC